MQLEPSKRYGSWSGAEIEAFFADARVPLRLSFEGDAGLLIVPVWFEYGSNHFVCCSPNDSLLVRALRKQPKIAFDVSTNDIPYQGVRGRGVARCSEAPDKQALETLLNRYLANTDNKLSQWLLNRQGVEALIHIQIEWLTSWDFSGRMGDIEKICSRRPGSRL